MCVCVSHLLAVVYLLSMRNCAAAWKSSNTFCFLSKQPPLCHVRPYSLHTKKTRTSEGEDKRRSEFLQKSWMLFLVVCSHDEFQRMDTGHNASDKAKMVTTTAAIIPTLSADIHVTRASRDARAHHAPSSAHVGDGVDAAEVVDEDDAGDAEPRRHGDVEAAVTIEKRRVLRVQGQTLRRRETRD